MQVAKKSHLISQYYRMKWKFNQTKNNVSWLSWNPISWCRNQDCNKKRSQSANKTGQYENSCRSLSVEPTIWLIYCGTVPSIDEKSITRSYPFFPFLISKRQERSDTQVQKQRPHVSESNESIRPVGRDSN